MTNVRPVPRHRTPRLAGQARPRHPDALAPPDGQEPGLQDQVREDVAPAHQDDPPPSAPSAPPAPPEPAAPASPPAPQPDDDVAFWMVTEEVPAHRSQTPGLESVLVFAGGDLAPEIRERQAVEAVEELERATAGLLGSAPPRDVVDGLVDDLARTCGADVALLRGGDEEGWRVVAGAGLRPLEVRPLPALPDLVARLVPTSPMLTVADTDQVRGQVAGLPLSRHRSLLVVREPSDLVVVVGREVPLGPRDVEEVARLLRQALPRLRRTWRVEAALLALVDWFDPGDEVR